MALYAGRPVQPKPTLEPTRREKARRRLAAIRLAERRFDFFDSEWRS